MKTVIITILISISLVFLGCGNDLVNHTCQLDNTLGNSYGYFSIVQEYGYCDTVCIGENVILYDYILPYSLECDVSTVNTLDTVYNGLYKSSFFLTYNTQNPVTIDFGNGISKNYNGWGIDTVKYFCNETYEVIICYDN